ncbi:MAG TPA: hypothetical protein VER03_20375, partial [Bryobacteraceae bacterium]|nr:hypothetical protein [Bryobacteraceae bacterium]
MATTVDLTLGLNLTVGSVPVSLQADINSSPTQTVYTFDGCIQEAAIPLGRFISFVGSQFNVAVALPPELNLAAEIDYLVGQVIYTKPTTGNAKTELGVSGKFDLTVGADKFSLQFYADVMIEDPAPTTGNLYVVGAAIDTELSFANL